MREGLLIRILDMRRGASCEAPRILLSAPATQASYLLQGFNPPRCPFAARLTRTKTQQFQADYMLLDQNENPNYAPAMKLTENEREVLAHVRLDTEHTVAQVAKHIGIKPASVRSVIERLRTRKIISRFALINVSRLGYTEYDITCGLALKNGEERARFFQYLRQSPCVSLLLEAGGPYHCVFTVCAQSPAHLDAFLQELGDRFGNVFINESIGICLRYSIFPPKYLSKRKPLKKRVEVATMPPDPKLDEADKLILAALAEFPDSSAREISRHVQMPISTVSYRLNSLQKSGALLGYVYMVFPKHFEHQAFRVHLSLRGLNSKSKKAIQEFSESHPNISYLVEWLGNWQYCLGIMAEDSVQAGTVVNEIYDTFGQSLNELSLFPVIQAHKVQFAPFSDELRAARQRRVRT